MVPVSAFSGFGVQSGPWPRHWLSVVSLHRCMTGLRLMQVKTDRTGFGAPGANAKPDRLLGIFRHQLLQLGSRGVIFKIRRAGPTKDAGEFGPGIRRAHVDNPHRLDLWAGRLDAKEV